MAHSSNERPGYARVAALPMCSPSDCATCGSIVVWGGDRPQIRLVADGEVRRVSRIRLNLTGGSVAGFVTTSVSMTSSNASAAAPRRQLEPTHPCIRCGREGVPADAGLCEFCNPLELSQPSATQMHGIAAAGILAFILVLALAGRAVLSGTGPFSAQVLATVPTVGGLQVMLAVSNEGEKAASTTCLVRESPARIGAPSEIVQTPLIQPGRTVQFTSVVTKLGTEVITLAAECQSP